MSFDQIYEYCMAKKGVEPTFPFDEVTLVFKVLGKMFALIPTEKVPVTISLKCDPERSLELRDQYSDIEGAYHMSKKHWNMINCEGEVPPKLLFELVDHSYDLVVSKMKKSDRELLN